MSRSRLYKDSKEGVFMDNQLAQYRQLFPTLQDKIILSSCSQSAISTTVNAAIDEYESSLRTDGMDWQTWMDRVEKAKESFARMIGADKSEIAVMSSVSEIISGIVTSVSFDQERNELVTTELDFPTIGHVFLAQERSGARVTFIPTDQLTVPLEYYRKFISEQTLLTCVAHVSYYTGYKQDIKEIASIAHEKGSFLLVDAYQSTGCLPINVKEMDIDILVSGAQKYLLGIPGIAFVYMRKDLSEKMKPRVTGWFGQADPFAFNIRQLLFADGVRRFETGTPAVVNAYAAAAGMDLLLDVGLERVHRYLEELSAFALDYGTERGLKMISPHNVKEKSPTTSFWVGDGQRVEQQLKERGFVTSARKDVIRIAPHFYNTKEDIRLAIDELSNIMAQDDVVKD